MVELGSKLVLLKMPISKCPSTRHQQNKTTETNKPKTSWGRKWHPSGSSPFQSSGVMCPHLLAMRKCLSPELLHFFLDFLEPEPSQSFSTLSWGRENVRFWHDSFAYIHVYGNEKVTCIKSLCVSRSQFMTVDLVTERRPYEPQRETWYFLSGSERQWRLLSSFFFHNL